MKRILLLLLFPIVASAQNVMPAYVEKAPQNLQFGTFSAVAPYNEANNYTLVPDSQIEPSSVNLLSNTFSSSAAFTLYTPSFAGAQGSFSVASNTGTTSTSGSNQGIIAADTGDTYPLTVPLMFVSAKITANGTSATNDAVGVGICKDGSNFLIAHLNKDVPNAAVTIDVAGTTTDLAVVSGISVPTAPWYLGFTLINNQAAVFDSTDGVNWSILTNSSVSTQYNFNTAGNLTGWHVCIETDASNATSWQWQNLKFGLTGGLGLRDIATVTYEDGRPYMRGSVAYFTATIGGVGSNFQSSGVGVFSYDLSGGTLTQIGSVADNRNAGNVYEDSACQITYNPPANIERLLCGTWATAAAGTAQATTVYASQSITTDDWLAAGPHVSPAATTFTIPNYTYAYDANLACSQYNYSANTCSNWVMAITGTTGVSGSGVPEMLQSTSDPSANTWSVIKNDTSQTGSYEGSRVIRTAIANGASGVSDYFAYGGRINSAVRTSLLYDPSGTYLGQLAVTWPQASANPSHPNILEYGNNAYLVTFNDNYFVSSSSNPSSMGNFLVATAPRYSTAAAPVNVVGSTTCVGTSTAVSTFSCTYTMQNSNDTLIAFMSTLTAVTSPSFSSSPAYTWTQREYDGSTTSVWADDAQPTASGSITVTANWTTASQYPAISLIEISGSNGTFAGGSKGPYSTSGTSFSSNAFTTTGRCAGLMIIRTNSPVTYSSIMSIGGAPASAISGTSNLPQSAIATLNQPVTNQIGTATWNTSFGNNGVVLCYGY